MVIFLHGEDTYRSRQKLRELREKFLRDVDPSGSNLVTIDGTTASASEVWGAIAAQSFLVRKRMVVIERIGEQKSAGTREEIAAFLDRIPADVIVVFWESKSHAPAPSRSPTSSSRAKRGISPKLGKGTATKGGAQKHDPLFLHLLKEQFAQELTPLQGRDLESWIRERATSLGATIELAATRDLIAIVGSDLWRMRQELEKLALTAAGQPIMSAMVRELVSTVPQEDIFGFVDAIGRGDRVAAIRILRELESARVDPQYLLAMVYRQLRLLAMAADGLERGTPPSRLAAELGVHPYVAQKLGQQVRTMPLSRIRALFPQLLDLDRTLKSSRAPWGALMELFCLEATAARR